MVNVGKYQIYHNTIRGYYGYVYVYIYTYDGLVEYTLYLVIYHRSMCEYLYTYVPIQCYLPEVNVDICLLWT